MYKSNEAVTVHRRARVLERLRQNTIFYFQTKKKEAFAASRRKHIPPVRGTAFTLTFERKFYIK